MSYDNATIFTTMRQIRNKELVLPAIQRDFVWSPERISHFLDSLMREYPIGTLLFWNTRQRVQYREFDRDKTDGSAHTFQIKEANKRGTVVLDGQQRLQSLYLALHGTLDRKQLFFDVLSGTDPEDTSEAKFHFEFLSPQTADERNRRYDGQRLWVPLREINNCGNIPERRRLTEHYITQAGIDRQSENSHRLANNVEIAHSKLRSETILSYYTIDPDYGEDAATTPIDEILEIFVRINSGGQVLSKSDLMFSLMQLHWEETAEKIENLLDQINTNTLAFDKDFVLRCALVCCGKGARYQVDKLRDPATIDRIEAEFPRIAQALQSCVTFLKQDAKIEDSRVLGSRNALIPFIYFLYRQQNQQAKGETVLLAMKQALYLALMTSALSRYADSRIDGLIREVFEPALATSPADFPLTGFRTFIRRREGHDRIDNQLLQRNITLLMNILEGGITLSANQQRRRPEVDHIFPQSKLREQGYEADQINDFANLRLISKIDNIWKSNTDPKPYFDTYPGVAEQYLIPTNLLEYEQYPEFLLVRRKKIWERVQTFLGLSAEDLPAEDRLVPGEENAVIDRAEQQLRNLIDQTLSQAVQGDYWKPLIPGDIKNGVKQRINDYLTLHPEKSWADYTTGRSRLDFCDVSDYEKIIITKSNWALFEPLFRNRNEFERHMSAVRRLRNSVKHGRPIDEVERLTGEAGLLWLRRAFNLAPASATEPTAQATPWEKGYDKPTPEDYHRLLTRIPVPRGQQQLYYVLYTHHEGLSAAELVHLMGRRDQQDLSGVLGALGRRINNTPGWGQTTKQGILMVMTWRERPDGESAYLLLPETRQALETLNPSWLHQLTP